MRREGRCLFQILKASAVPESVAKGSFGGSNFPGSPWPLEFHKGNEKIWLIPCRDIYLYFS